MLVTNCVRRGAAELGCVLERPVFLNAAKGFVAKRDGAEVKLIGVRCEEDGTGTRGATDPGPRTGADNWRWQNPAFAGRPS